MIEILIKGSKFIFILGVVFLTIWALSSCSGSAEKDVALDIEKSKNLPDKIDFNFHIKPILSDRCFTCHGPDENKREAGLALHTKALAFAALGEDADRYAIVEGDVESSELVKRIFDDNPDNIMPPLESNLVLDEYEKKLLKKWIEQGAEWKTHWAFTKPVHKSIPTIKNEAWAKNEIDFFVIEKLEDLGLSISPQAKREKLIRRASFDLTGLAPSQEILLRYTQSDKFDFKSLIDELLASDAYAERMAVDWLDLARYADTNGYQDDFERFNWPWRDWVIHAFNKNLPFDEFVTWQIAGDLLPNATMEQIIATGFNRNHKITNEGGAIPEEYRVEYVSDRANTFGTAFLGLTFECAKCHDHKYDPLSQANYYELFSFFNNVPEEGFVEKDQKPEPTITLSKKDLDATLEFINGLDSLQELTYMVMEEMSPPRQAHILSRGAYDQPAEKVYPNTPAAILPFDESYQQDRKGLTDWLFNEDNPLTARVAVNRLWQQLFGNGLVATSNDFGNQGALPSHPDLLDFLALRYQETGWDTKAMLKYMMMSASYQQSSVVTEDLLELDPENRYLARAPKLRLPAEMIRDHALDIADLLVDKIGGPSVKPYQPAGLWAETTGGGGGSTSKYVEDEDEGLYRRSLYTFWKRTVPPPSMMTFDAASRDICTVKRQNTSTPLQALVMLNDPQIIEAARMLAYRSIKEIEDNVGKRIEYMFLLATSRIPEAEELKMLEGYFKEEKERFDESPTLAMDYLSVGNFQMERMIDDTSLAAYALVASAIMNLDETISRG